MTEPVNQPQLTTPGRDGPKTNGSKTDVSKKRRTTAYVAGGLAVGLGVAGLGTAAYQMTNGPAVITSALFGKRAVTFDKQPAIQVDNGTIQSVTVKPIGGGNSIAGSLEPQGERYLLNTSDLSFGTKYRVTTVATNGRGHETVQKNTFRTFAPDEIVATSVNVEDGATYGVGMPITITFSGPVANRAKLERHLRVTTNQAQDVVGSWSWESDSQVSYRPKSYWPANTTVTVTGDIKGVRTDNGVTPGENVNLTFKIGAKQIMVVDSTTHQMVFRKNGKVINRFPVSLGRPGYETRSGIKVVMSRETDITFDAGSLGVPEDDPDYYRLDIAYAMRLTWSGEYIHSAPWSVGSQGYSNVSHGCTNVSTDNAAWLYRNTHVGDIVKVKNTGRPQDLGNGITVWNETWEEWRSGSAL